MVKLTSNVVLSRSRATDLDNVRKLNCWFVTYVLTVWLSSTTKNLAWFIYLDLP